MPAIKDTTVERHQRGGWDCAGRSRTRFSKIEFFFQEIRHKAEHRQKSSRCGRNPVEIAYLKLENLGSGRHDEAKNGRVLTLSRQRYAYARPSVLSAQARGELG